MSQTSTITALLYKSTSGATSGLSHSGSTSHTTIESLSKKESKFLPSGDWLPANFNVAMMKKVPMFPAPSGVLQLYTKKLAEAPFMNKCRLDFDLTDPNNYSINNRYNSLTDPNLVYHVNKPRVHKQLVDIGQLTPDDKVLCTRKEYSQYVDWLKHVGRLQFRKHLQLERKKVEEELRAEAKARLTVAIMTTRVSEQLVQSGSTAAGDLKADSDGASGWSSTDGVRASCSRASEWTEHSTGQFDAEDSSSQPRSAISMGDGSRSTLAPALSNMDNAGHLGEDADLEHQISVVRQHQEESQHQEEKQQKEESQPQEEQESLSPISRKIPRVDDCFQQANVEYRRRQKQQLTTYREKLLKQLDLLKQAEDTRLDNCANKVKESWKRPGDIIMQHQRPPVSYTEDSHARLLRFQKQLAEEMNRRWQLKAGRMKELKDRARERHRLLGQTYFRNFATVFATPPQPSLQLAIAGPTVKEERGQNKSNVETPVSVRKEARRKVSGDEQHASRHSSLDKVGFLMPPDTSCDDITRRPRARSSAESRLTAYGAESSISFSKQSNMDSMSARSLSGGKKKHSKRSASRIKMAAEECKGKKYPTVLRPVGYDDGASPGDEVCLVVPHEVILQNTRDEAEMCEVKNEGENDLDESLFSRDLVRIASDEMEEDVLPEGMSLEEREAMEALLQRVLNDLTTGRLDRDDMVTLAACCASLTEVNLMEQATSTTSLDFETEASLHPDRSATSSLVSKPTTASEELLSHLLVDKSIKDTMCQLTQDMGHGSLCRDEVREIGSAVASVVMGAVKSDSSMLDDEVVPALEMLLKDTEDIDEDLLDQTMASLLSSYRQVAITRDEYPWQTIKNFAVEVLGMTKTAMMNGTLDVRRLLDKVKDCKVTALHHEMELPDEHEFPMVLSTAIRMVSAVEVLCPVLCDLMRVVLDEGQAILMQCQQGDSLVLPHFDSSSIEEVGESASGLQVMLEVAASVCKGLQQPTAADCSLCERLAPPFILHILACWGELQEAVPTETVGSQTTEKDTSYSPSLAENLVLVSLNRLWRSTVRDEYPQSVIARLTLHLAHFPALVPPSSELHYLQHQEDSLPGYIAKKIAKLSKKVRNRGLTSDEYKKLLAVVLQVYIREGMQQEEDNPSWPVHPTARTTTSVNVITLVSNVTRMVLHLLYERVKQKLEAENITEPRCSELLVSEVLQLMSDFGAMEIKDMVDLGSESSLEEDVQIEMIVRATTDTQYLHNQPTAVSIRQFLQRIWKSVDSCPHRGTCTVVLDEKFKPAGIIIRRQLGKLARDVCNTLTAAAMLEEQQADQPCSELDKMTTFLVALLIELRHAVLEAWLTAPQAFQLLRVVARERCQADMEWDGARQTDLIMAIVRDVEIRGNKSPYFRRLVRHLSKMSVEKASGEEVAEGMAATAHILSSVNADIVTKFIHTSLFSLLSSLSHNSRSGQSGEQSMGDRQPSTTVHESCSEDQPKPSAQTKDSSIDLGHMPQQPSLEPTSSSESEYGTDRESNKEINHEATIIAHMAVQTVLERLGVDTGKQSAKVTSPTTSDVKRLLQQIVDVASCGTSVQGKDVGKRFSDLEPAMAMYAQDLLEDAVRYVDDSGQSAEVDGQSKGKPVMCTDSIATIIINKTFKSIETALSTGKVLLQGQRAPPLDALKEVPLVSLSNCITSTLCAVQSELDIVDMACGTDTDRHQASYCLVTLTAARSIVQFLLQRLHSDTSDGKVEFRLTLDKKLTVVNTVPFSPATATDDSETRDIWNAPDLAKNVLQVFRDVLSDMHCQNQFFNPDLMETAETVNHGEVVILPCLPFLLDDLILSSMKQIADHLTQEHPMKALSSEVLLVGSTIQTVFNDMSIKSMQATTQGQPTAELENKRLVVLRILKDAMKGLPADANDTISPNSPHRGSIDLHRQQLQALRRESCKDSSDEKSDTILYRTKRTQSEVKADLQKLLMCIRGVKLAADEKTGSDPTTVHSTPQRQLVMSAISQIILSVQQDRVTDDALSDLYGIFQGDVSDTAPEERRSLLLKELRGLSDSVSGGVIPIHLLHQASEEICFLEKEKVAEDPRKIAKVVRKLSLSSNPDFMKMAVAELLMGNNTENMSGMTLTGAPSSLSDKRSDELARGAKSSRRLTEYDCAEVTPIGKRSSIVARTVSKICIGDETENRENNTSAVYSMPLTLTGSPFSIISRDHHTVIPEQSETDTSHRLDECLNQLQLGDENDSLARSTSKSDLSVLEEKDDAEDSEETAQAKLETSDLELGSGEEADGGERAEGVVGVGRTVSDVSKDSGSKASVEAASEDWNTSAIRAARRDRACRIDHVHGGEAAHAEEAWGTPPPPLHGPAAKDQQRGGLQWLACNKPPADGLNPLPFAKHSHHSVADLAAIADTVPGPPQLAWHEDKKRARGEWITALKHKESELKSTLASEKDTNGSRDGACCVGGPTPKPFKVTNPKGQSTDVDFMSSVRSHGPVSECQNEQQENTLSKCVRKVIGSLRRRKKGVRESLQASQKGRDTERLSQSCEVVLKKQQVKVPKAPPHPCPHSCRPCGRKVPGSYPQSILIKCYSSSPEYGCNNTEMLDGTRPRSPLLTKVTSHSTLSATHCSVADLRLGKSHYEQLRDTCRDWCTFVPESPHSSHANSSCQNGKKADGKSVSHLRAQKLKNSLCNLKISSEKNCLPDLSVESVRISPLDLSQPASCRVGGQSATQGKGSRSAPTLPLIRQSASANGFRPVQGQVVKLKNKMTSRFPVSVHAQCEVRPGAVEAGDGERLGNSSGTVPRPPPTNRRPSSVNRVQGPRQCRTQYPRQPAALPTPPHHPLSLKHRPTAPTSGQRSAGNIVNTPRHLDEEMATGQRKVDAWRVGRGLPHQASLAGSRTFPARAASHVVPAVGRWVQREG